MTQYGKSAQARLAEKDTSSVSRVGLRGHQQLGLREEISSTHATKRRRRWLRSNGRRLSKKLRPTAVSIEEEEERPFLGGYKDRERRLARQTTSLISARRCDD
ncbi:hypothetical protein Csa_018378 [Cucumis sativus]|uniref:Uncharacterized protein n=1 Tax=Cucumis sativus TaxID=3659 RepID=A0A0A0KIN0_CUCSA|nr:hypothetical protein Csa_018378 [Cucumis sativus]